VNTFNDVVIIIHLFLCIIHMSISVATHNILMYMFTTYEKHNYRKAV